MGNHVQLILVLDEPPEHIQLTFSLSRWVSPWRSGLPGIVVAVEGDDIDLEAQGYVLVFAKDDYHTRAAVTIYDQIKSLKRDALVMSLPVEVDPPRKPVFPG